MKLRYRIALVVFAEACYAIGCFTAYQLGKTQGASDAYGDCANMLKKFDSELRAMYPECFEKYDDEEES